MIITDNTPKKAVLPPPELSPELREQYRTWRDEVAWELSERGHVDEAERWDYCDSSPKYKIDRAKPELPPSATTVWVCSGSHACASYLFSPTCDFRICPECAHRHTARLMKKYVPVIEKQLELHPEFRLRTITLTRSVQLGDDDFSWEAQNGFDLIQKTMALVVGSHWNKDGAGLLANWEVGPNGQRLHYHGVYLGPWVDQRLLSKAWRFFTGGDRVVWVRAVKHNDDDWKGAVSETLKYATKFYSQDKVTKIRIYLSARHTVDLFEAMKGTRRIRAWGSFYAAEAEVARVFCCDECDQRMVRVGIGYYEYMRIQGFSEASWKTAIKKSLLKYRIANKSHQTEAKKDNMPSKSTRLLPFMDTVATKETTHYDYE